MFKFAKTRIPVTLKHNLRDIAFTYRLITASNRQLPSFIVLGAQRAGTSSLYWNLCQHPDIIAPWLKEVHYFDTMNYEKHNLNWYKAHFPFRNKASTIKLTFEATPAYLFRLYVIPRVLDLIPNAKFIILLRHPIERTYSGFRMAQRKGYQSESFQESLEKELNYIHSVGLSLDTFRVRNFPVNPHILRSIYIYQLRGWFQHFPREQFLILDSEEYFTKPIETLNALCNFLKISPWPFAGYSSGPKPRPMYREMLPDTYFKLQTFFEPYNEQLYSLLGSAYNWD